MNTQDDIAGQQTNPVAEPRPPSVFHHDGSLLKDIDPASITACDFRAPGFLGQKDLQQLGALHQRFVQHACARLSMFLRMECELKIATFNTMPFGEFSASIGNPSHVTLFQAEPMQGIAILDMGVRLGLAMADRILGGKGRVEGVPRSLTEIELALLEDVVAIILGEWAQLWPGDGGAPRPQCIGVETSGCFLQTSAPDATIVVVAIEVILGENIDQIQIGFPFSMIEPAVKKMQAEHRQGEEASPRQIQWRTPYNGILVPVTAEWDFTEMTLREVIGLEPGQVLEMPRDLLTQTRVRFADTHEFLGTAGVKSGHTAVQLTLQKTLND
jgi:flagellar motor switch protein FliM